MAHTNHSSYAAHSNHASTTYPIHSNHTNSVTNVNRCDTVGTTLTKLSNPQTKITTWDDLKAKINDVRHSWGLSGGADVTYSPSSDAKAVASEWNSYVRDPLTQSPIPNSAKYATIIDPATATSGSTPLSTVSYDHGVNSAQSKKCISICLSVCDPYTNTHSNHSSHTAHSNHGSHASHTNHSFHNSHAEHDQHSDHSSHFNHGSSMCNEI